MATGRLFFLKYTNNIMMIYRRSIGTRWHGRLPASTKVLSKIAPRVISASIYNNQGDIYEKVFIIYGIRRGSCV